MKYKFFSKEISGPFTIPSGIITTETTTLEKIANEIPEIGILTTKSIGPKPQEGNREPIIAQHSPFSFVNAVGLTNPGADEFAKRISKISIPKDKFLLISIFGRNEEEFMYVAEKLVKFADGFELNISCPHSEKYGQAIGQDNELVEKIVKKIVSLNKPVFVKISPNLDVKKTVKHAIAGGVSGFTAINTKGPEEYLHDGNPVLSNRVGGVSGRAILESGLSCVQKIRDITDLPIIACGGISTKEEIEKYRRMGANFFGVGSALAGMNSEELKQYFFELNNDLEKGTNKAVSFLKEELKTTYLKYRVEENISATDDLMILKLNNALKVEPGQFVFLWLPGKGEKPFSVFDDIPLTFFIQKRGCFTNELSKLKKGDTVYVRGPYGNSPKINGKTLLVGGGCGIAALYLFAKRSKNTISLLGGKNKDCLPYQEKFRSRSQKLYLFTENGDIDAKGFVTDKLEEIIEKEKPEYCINCGPEGMIREAVNKESKYLSKENIYSSIDFVTKCGIGLCGSCASLKGHRSCVDGTFLTSNQI